MKSMLVLAGLLLTIGMSLCPINATALNYKPEDEFNVSIELVLFAEQINKYPITTLKFREAVKEWSSKLPIQVTIYIEETNPIHSVLDRPGVISILMFDIQAASTNMEGVLGLWQPNMPDILLDADFLEEHPDIAYSVSLHELGHMLGVPHIVSKSEYALTGYLTLTGDRDASTFVMYPEKSWDKPQDVLSEIEISLARFHVLHFMTDPNGRVNHVPDCLYHR